MTAAPDSTFLCVRAGRRRYAVAQDLVGSLAMLDPASGPADARGRPLICRELAELMGEAATIGPGRRHALVVALRRRSVALLVDHIDSLGDAGGQAAQALPPLLARGLARPWFLGAIVSGDEPLLLLDLRRIATDVAAGAA